MKKNSFLLLAATAALSMGGIAAVCVNKVPSLTRVARNVSYTISLDSNDFKNLTSEYQAVTAVQDSSETSGDYKFTFNLAHAKKDDSNNLVLGNLGKILNFSTTDTNYYSRIESIQSIKAVYTGGSLSLRTSIRNDGKALGKAVSMESGVEVVTTTDPYYFCIDAGESPVTISSLEIKYTCVANPNTKVESYEGVFTGKAEGKDTVYQITVNDGNARIESLNLKDNLVMEGTVSVNHDNDIECAFTYNTYPLTYVLTPSSGHSLTFKSVTDSVGGAIASNIDHISFTRVYTLDDFESYGATGQGYVQTKSRYEMSGLRGRYYGDYYSGGASNPSLIATSGYSLMGSSSDYMTLSTTEKHSGSNSMKVKASTKWMRYWQYDNMLGLPYVKGKGAYLSLWAKGATTCDAKMKLGAIKTNAAMTEGNRNNMTYVQQIIIPKNSPWTEYKIALEESTYYYGYYLAFDNSGADGYPYIDDVKIYTTSPYEEYVEPNYRKTVTYKGSVAIASIAQGLLGDSIDMTLALGMNGEGIGYFYGKKITINSYDQTSDGKVSLNTSFSYSTPLGTATIESITGDQSGTTLSNVELKGDLMSDLVANNGSITLSEQTQLLSSCDQSTNTLRATFSRYYDPGSGWTLDSNDDRIVASTNDPIEGTGCMSVRGYSKFRIVLANDMPAAQAWKSAGLWIRNDGTKAYTLKFFFYKSTGLTNYINPSSATVPADGNWHYYQTGIDSNFTYYNLSLYFDASGAASTDKVSIDYMHIL